MEMTIQLDQRSVDELKRAVDQVGGKLNRELASAVNKTAGRTKTEMAKGITERLNAPQKNVKENMPRVPRARVSDPSTQVRLQHSRRLGLHKLNRTRHGVKGVAYRVDKKKSRKLIEGGFMGPKPGRFAPKLKGLVAVRRGRRSYPLRFPKGVSPWGMFIKQKMKRKLVKRMQKILAIEIQRRVRTVLVKAGFIPT